MKRITFYTLIYLPCLFTLTNSRKHHNHTFWPPRSNEANVVAFIREKSHYYGRASRPILNESEPVHVNVSLRLIQVDVNEPQNTLTTSVWCTYRWYDAGLKWNISDFNGVDKVVIPADWVWLPDLSLANTADTAVSERHADVKIYNTGGIYWLVHRVLKSACLFDVTDYPFDHHRCHLWFQSLSSSSSQLDPYPIKFDLDTYLSDFKKADEWEIVDTNKTKVSSPRELGELLMFSRRVTLRFSLILKRRAGFQAYLLTVPCVVLGSLSILVFSLPPERPDRHALATSLLGSFIMLLLLLVSTAPPSAASVPKLGLFYAFNICIIVLSLCLSAIVINVSRLGDYGYRMPRFVEKIFLECLASILLVSCARRAVGQNKERPDPEEEPTVEKLALSQSFSNGRLVKVVDPAENDELLNSGALQVDGDTGPMIGNNDAVDSHNKAVLLKVALSLSRILSTLTSIEIIARGMATNKNILASNATEAQKKWKAVGAVLDRLFMVMYIVIICISLGLLLPRAHTL